MNGDFIKLAADLKNELRYDVICVKEWLVNFKVSKTKFLFINHQKYLFLLPIIMVDSILHVSDFCLKRKYGKWRKENIYAKPMSSKGFITNNINTDNHNNS